MYVGSDTSEEGMVSALERMVVDGIFELSKEGNESLMTRPQVVASKKKSW